MREYLFRGKSRDTKEWVIGYLLVGVFGDKLIQRVDKIGDTMIVIDPDTIGQLLPVRDFDGLDLYEGDIVAGMRTPDNFHGSRSPVFPKRIEYRVVEYSNTKTSSSFELPKDISYSERSVENNIKWRLVGNKWDNPELLQSL